MARAIFCNVARMVSYRGRTGSDSPVGGGSHPEQGGGAQLRSPRRPRVRLRSGGREDHRRLQDRTCRSRRRVRGGGRRPPDRGRDVVGWYGPSLRRIAPASGKRRFFRTYASLHSGVPALEDPRVRTARSARQTPGFCRRSRQPFAMPDAGPAFLVADPLLRAADACRRSGSWTRGWPRQPRR